MTHLFAAVLYALIPCGVALLGTFFGSKLQMSKPLTSNLQHLVAGIVIAAVSLELLPEIVHQESSIRTIIAFIFGVGVMTAVHEMGDKFSRKKSEASSMGLVFAAGLDLFLDGLLIGIAFLGGEQSGFLIALSLSFCAFFLAMAVAKEVESRLTHIILAALLPMGALIGSIALRFFPATMMIECLTFGVGALLYLGIEELLGRAHQSKDKFWTPLLFFGGFVILLVIKQGLENF